jgi:hypothetical protein
LITEGTTEKISQIIVALGSVYSKNFCFMNKKLFLTFQKGFLFNLLCGLYYKHVTIIDGTTLASSISEVSSLLMTLESSFTNVIGL